MLGDCDMRFYRITFKLYNYNLKYLYMFLKYIPTFYNVSYVN